MRADILIWSTLSGVVLGLFTGAGLLALGVLVHALLPGSWARVVERLTVPALVLALVVVPLAGGVLGFLEGRLKLR